ncbi:phasin family protein [Catenuloplanes atrovinosus]|uniref:Polyhydroxyalkanoate synthesis regulator phasin n=1 Tax=Catenuloplanes atrovinosus TaxID=137266 RepID=A0AAE4C7B9_9ACTN|nr:hypothetical protein [Catenuloplanes atrovinosus]MDR7274376.1 polyhydroxyalkanoate synthesis regulator phasin [Catenuloplanes atrovinosus]
MQKEAWRAYLDLALGLTESSRKQATRTAMRLVGKGGATAAQLQTMVEEALAAGTANRAVVERLVRNEVDRALGVVGLAKSDDVAALRQRVADLEARLAGPVDVPGDLPVDATVEAAAAASAATVAPVTPAPGTPLAKKTVAKKAVAKKAVAKAPAGGTAVPDALAAPAAPAEDEPVVEPPSATPAQRITPPRKAPARKTPADLPPAVKKAPAKRAKKVAAPVLDEGTGS